MSPSASHAGFVFYLPVTRWLLQQPFPHSNPRQHIHLVLSCFQSYLYLKKESSELDLNSRSTLNISVRLPQIPFLSFVSAPLYCLLGRDVREREPVYRAAVVCQKGDSLVPAMPSLRAQDIAASPSLSSGASLTPARPVGRCNISLSRTAI